MSYHSGDAHEPIWTSANRLILVQTCDLNWFVNLFQVEHVYFIKKKCKMMVVLWWCLRQGFVVRFMVVAMHWLWVANNDGGATMIGCRWWLWSTVEGGSARSVDYDNNIVPLLRECEVLCFRLTMVGLCSRDKYFLFFSNSLSLNYRYC